MDFFSPHCLWITDRFDYNVSDFCPFGMEEGQMYPVMFSLWKQGTTEWNADVNEWHQKPYHPDSQVQH